jgi:hypothetical protein
MNVNYRDFTMDDTENTRYLHIPSAVSIPDLLQVSSYKAALAVAVLVGGHPQ